jgi:hypothetical protein
MYIHCTNSSGIKPETATGSVTRSFVQGHRIWAIQGNLDGIGCRSTELRMYSPTIEHKLF